MNGVEHPADDKKDWLWVTGEACPQCGFDPAAIDREAYGGRLRALAGAWRGVLGRGEVVKTRPPAGPDGVVWSALEYGAHVRDVAELFNTRITRMLKKKNPKLANFDHQQAAIDGAYSDADPDKVAFHLATHLGKVADMVDRVQGDGWSRPGVRSDGSPMTVESATQILLHEVTHHLHDAEAGIAALTEDQ